MTKYMLLILMLPFLSCNSEKNSNLLYAGKSKKLSEDLEMLEDDMEQTIPMTREAQAPPEYTLDQGSKIIKNGRLSFEVTTLNTAKTQLDTLLKIHNAYYEKEQYHSYGNRNNYSLLIRVPNEKFESLLSQIENGTGEMKSKEISARDVTEEYVDLNIRLESNLAYLKQYKVILQKAKSIEELLEVQEKIRRIEEEIDSKKGRIKYLDNKVSYSTINLELSELISSTLSNKPSFGLRIQNAFMSGIKSFSSFFISMVQIWPFLFMFAILFLARKRIFSKLKLIKRNK